MFNKIASNTISQILSKVGTALISIFLISILTNYLTIELYGLYSKIYNYLGIFVFLADLGLYTITIREITLNKEKSSEIIGNIMSLRLLLGIFILFLSILIAFFLPGYNTDLALYSIFIVGLFNVFQLFNSSLLALMQANMKIEFSLISTIFGKLLNLSFIIFIVYFLYKKQDIISFYTPFILIMISGIIGIIFNTFLNFLYARKICLIRFMFDFGYIKHIFKISLPYGIALFLSVVYFKVDVILLSLIEGPGMGDLSIALYSLPMKIVEVIMVLGAFYLNSLLPSLTKEFEKHKQISKGTSYKSSILRVNKISNLIDVSFRVLFGGACLIFVLGILFRDYLIEIIANKGYLETSHLYNSSDAFLIVFAVIVFHFISLIFIYSLLATKNQSKLLGINIFVTFFNIIGNIILIPKYSFIGAGIITLFSQILLMMIGYVYTKKIINFKIPFLYIIKNIIFGTIIYLIFNYILTNFSIGLYKDLIIYGGIGFIFYAGFLYLDFKKQEI